MRHPRGIRHQRCKPVGPGRDTLGQQARRIGHAVIREPGEFLGKQGVFDGRPAAGIEEPGRLGDRGVAAARGGEEFRQHPTEKSRRVRVAERTVAIVADRDAGRPFPRPLQQPDCRDRLVDRGCRRLSRAIDERPHEPRRRAAARADARCDLGGDLDPGRVVGVPLAGKERRGDSGARGRPLEPHDPRQRLDTCVVVEPQKPVHQVHAGVEVAADVAIEEGGHRGRIGS